MSSQLGSLQFISEGSTKRKEILAKFLDLEIFDKKYKLAKEDATDLRGALRRTEDINYDDEIYETEKQLMFSENEIKEQNHFCEQLNKDLNNLRAEKNDLKTKISSIPADVIDINKISNERILQERNVLTCNNSITSCQVILDDNEQLLRKIAKFEESFDINTLQNKKEEIDKKLLTITNLLTELENTEKIKKINEKKVSLLDEVPCGEQFKSCKFIKDAHNSKNTLVDLMGQVKTIQEQKQNEEKLLKQTDEEKINNHLKKYKRLMEKKSAADRLVMKTALEKGKWENNATTAQNEVTRLLNLEDNYNQNRDIIENKGSFILELSKVTEALSKKEKEKQKCQDKLLDFYKQHGSLEQKIKHLEEKKSGLINLQEEFSAYDLFMRCMHPNGIAYDIIKRQLPIINEEVAKILANVVEFEAFFETDDKHLRIFIKHPKHEPRPIEMGSGAEKTLVAMAIRLALLTVSSLPKSDVFILDEPGTALDVENMDGFISILELIKTYFKTVFLISHLDGLKDCVDQQIVIDKKDGFAHISV
jgi:DNA repair exonuclease SbcCD ATPase subunit